MAAQINAICKPCKSEGVVREIKSEEKGTEHLWYQHGISTTPAYAWNWLLRAEGKDSL